jgi:DNA end-binding protein Ku
MAYRAAARNVPFVFGIINFPIKLHLACDIEDYEFKRITTSGNKMREKAVDEKSGQEVVRAQHYKGIILPDKSNVIFSDDEIVALRGGEQGLFIKNFVPLASVDTILFDKSYYLSPENGGEIAFKTFSLALEENTGMAAVGKWHTDVRENLVLVKPYRGGMLMHVIYYKNEVRPYEDNVNVDVSNDAVNATLQLMKMNKMDQFDPSLYKNEQIQRIANAIAIKQAAKAVPTEAVEAKPSGSEELSNELIKILESAIPSDNCKTNNKTKKKNKKRDN